MTDAVTATVEVEDAEGQPIDLDFTWSVAGREVIGLASAELAAGRHRKGDVIVVTVEASDGVSDVTMVSEPLTVANTPPVFDRTPGPRDRLDGFLFKAHDVDGDDITWRLEDAPAGMTIDARGMVRYAGSTAEKGGDYRVSVLAEDGGTWSKFVVPLSVSKGSGE